MQARFTPAAARRLPAISPESRRGILAGVLSSATDPITPGERALQAGGISPLSRRDLVGRAPRRCLSCAQLTPPILPHITNSLPAAAVFTTGARAFSLFPAETRNRAQDPDPRAQRYRRCERPL